ncbi:MAG: glutamyl-tRNA reductase, partial [Flavobacteriaceae bacterium]|nr:glutamyl-tRNA reductase [Flavobacteriaceae bacterium]
MLTESNSTTHFYGIGISYEKADAVTRGKFNITQTAQDTLAEEAKSKHYASLLIISTCNRTELYGNVAHPYELISLLCAHTNGTVEEFQQFGYLLKNDEAEQHLFRVGTGLDSQILGDFEIIGQIKKGFKLAKKLQLIDMRLERLVNAVIQASKRVKTETSLSEGATSVSFAAADYILKKVSNPHEKNILLFGVGKIGRNTCENLVKHTQNPHITLINRTRDKAETIAGKFNLLVKD